MLCRAAASLYELGLREQQRYPTKRFKLLQTGSAVSPLERSLEETAEDLLEDAKPPHLLDAPSEAHFKTYPTAQALISQESLVCLESEAMVLPETIQHSEAGHAQVKRSQRGREQTHKEQVFLASAMRTLRRECHDVDLLLPKQ